MKSKMQLLTTNEGGKEGKRGGEFVVGSAQGRGQLGSSHGATSNQALVAAAAAGPSHLAALTPPFTGQCWPGVSARPATQQACAAQAH